MNIFEIDQAILECIDAETGEIVDPDKLNALAIERETKIEGVALWYKNLAAEADAIKAEIATLRERQQRATNKAESLKIYLDRGLEGAKFSTAKVEIGYRKSKAVEIDDEDKLLGWALSEARSDLYKNSGATPPPPTPETIPQPICADCGNAVEPYGRHSAHDIAAVSEKRFGRILCSVCANRTKTNAQNNIQE